ncbi:MAG: hypothetical protein ABF420_06115 [Acetobacter syzygii]|uniref:hypothetical protein n=1 Tax=Acetobacter syzygii TaxID=146476 RepID=UPI0039E9A13C
MSSALAVVQLLAAHPESGCVIDVARLSSGAEAAMKAEGIAANKDAARSDAEIRNLDLSIKTNTAGLIQSIKPVAYEYRKRISLIENILDSEVCDDNLTASKEFSRAFLEEQIGAIEKNRSDLGPYLTDIPDGFSLMAWQCRKAARALPKYKNGRKSILRNSVFSISRNLSLGARVMREASIVQFRYLLLLKVIRGALDDQEEPSPVSSQEEMEALLNEVWA